MHPQRELWQCWRQEKNYAKVVNFLSLKSYLLSRIICFVSLFDFGAARGSLETSLKYSHWRKSKHEQHRAEAFNILLYIFNQIEIYEENIVFWEQNKLQAPRELLRRWASISECFLWK